MECVAPFTLKQDGSCCGTCTAPDHVVALDRHFLSAVPTRWTPSVTARPHSARVQ